MKRVVIYARVSTKDQQREGYSIPAQLRILREYAVKNKLSVAKEFLESESAGKAGRSQFGEMIVRLESDKSISAILVEKTDRLYRNFKDKVIIDDLGIDVHFVKDNRVIGKNSKSSDKFVNDIETAQARYFLNNLSDEVRKGLDQKARQGKYPAGPVPLGYSRNPITKQIEVDPVRAPIILRLFELYASGEHSIDSLHAESKKLALTYRKSGRNLARAEIHRILRRVLYTGKFIWKDLLYTGDHPPIIDRVLFEEVQSIIDGKSKGKGSKRNFTFSRLITCGECGHTVTAEIKKSKYVYYHCTAYGKKHKPVYLPESKIDLQMARIVGKVSLPYDFYEFLKYSFECEAGKQKIRRSGERDRLELERDKIQTRLKKAYEDKIDGLVSQKFFAGIYQ